MGMTWEDREDMIANSVRWQGPLPDQRYQISHEATGLCAAARVLANQPIPQPIRQVALCQSAKDGLAAGQLLCRRCKGAGTITDYAPDGHYDGADPRICTCWECDGLGILGARTIAADHAQHIITGIVDRYFDGVAE